MSAAEITRFAEAVARFADEVPGESIELVDEAITAQLRADTGGDGAFSHGRNLGRATTRVTARPGEAIVAPAGSRAVWGILQGGTSRGVAARHTFTNGASAGLDRAARDIETRWSRVRG